jgi:hypothetical protein
MIYMQYGIKCIYAHATHPFSGLIVAPSRSPTAPMARKRCDRIGRETPVYGEFCQIYRALMTKSALLKPPIRSRTDTCVERQAIASAAYQIRQVEWHFIAMTAFESVFAKRANAPQIRVLSDAVPAVQTRGCLLPRR